MCPIIEFNNVCFSYGRREVLHNVTFSLEANSFLGIVGPNGGGKTTLLRLMLGLERPGKGSIKVFGKLPETCRKRVGYVMQQAQYDSRFPATVMDISLMGRSGKRLWGPYMARDKRVAMESLEKVGMAAEASRPFAQLSGGQRQRALIAQALAGEPDLLILDEPTANIDAEGEDTIHKLLNAVASKLTVVSVSHNINTVLACVSHVLCLNKSAAINRLDQMHPGVLSRIKGGDIAVLHHELTCGVFDNQIAGGCAEEPSPPYSS